MRVVRPLVLPILIAVVVCSAQAIHAKDVWLSVRSANFHLVGNASEKDIRQVATKLEQFRYTFSLLFPKARFSSYIPTNVVVFKSVSAYRPFKPKRADGKPDDGIAGYFQSGEDVNYITLSTEGEKADTYGTIFHEFVHSLLNSTFGRSEVPPWFNEGLAEYYQTFRVKDDQHVILGSVQVSHLNLLSRTKLIPLREFFAIDNYSLHQNGDHSRSTFYAQAWALIHYLLQGNKGANTDELANFLDRVMNNEPPETAFRQAFGMDYEAMEKALKKYLAQPTFTATEVTLTRKLVFDDQMTTAPLGDAEANAYLGDLLYHTHEYAEAEAYLNKALEMSPGLGMARISLGLLKMRQRNIAEARKHLEAAIADDQQNHFAYYSYAYVLSRQSMDEFGYATRFPDDDLKKIRSSLDRAIKLNPEFPESYHLLAWVELVSGEDLDRALAAVKKGIALQPGNDEERLLLAQIYLRQKKHEEARQIADKLAKTAQDGSVRSRSREVADAAQRMIDAEKMAVEIEKQPPVTIDGKRPVFVKRSTLSDEQFARMERDREIRNINIVLGTSKVGSVRTLGHITSISCKGEKVSYTTEVAGAKLNLTSPDFQSLQLQILRDGASNIAVGCDADISKDLVVIDYDPAVKGGTLKALYFVPDDFRLMTAAEISSAPTIIVEGGTPTNTARNAVAAEEEKAMFEQKRREALMTQVTGALRKPLEGEKRILGTVSKVQCSGKMLSAFIDTSDTSYRLTTETPENIVLMILTPDASGLIFRCGAAFPGLNAVVTYRAGENDKDRSDGELIAVEFVPKSFRL